MRKQAWLAVAGILVAGVIGIAQSNEISNADEFEAAMKDVGKNFGAVRAAMEAREPDDVSSGAGQLVTIRGRGSVLRGQGARARHHGGR